MCVGGSRIPNLQMEFNYLDLFKSYGIFSNFVVPVVLPLSPSSPHHPHHPCHPHIIPIAPMWSPWLWSPWSPPHVVPVVPTSSPSSSCHLEGPHIIPNPPDTHSTHPHPPGGWGPQIIKNAIRFELIEIFSFCLKI